MKKTLNLLNAEDVKDYAKSLALNVPEHIQKWVTSTFMRWMLNNEAHCRQCVNAKELRSPMFKVLTTLIGALTSKKETVNITEQFHAVEAKDLPEWAVAALDNNELWFWHRPEASSEEHNGFQHWLDYCRTLPERDIRMTVPQMIVAVAAWDKQLAKQKLIAELSEGTEIVETAAIDVTTGLYLVRLLTKTAYVNESAVMRHCVKTYWGRKNTRIYSLRKTDEDRPIATIELCKEGKVISIEQIRGFANARISDEHKALIEAVAAEKTWAMYALASDDEEEDEDDGYAEDDEEEEDDEDEDEEIVNVRAEPDDEEEGDECEDECEDDEY